MNMTRDQYQALLDLTQDAEATITEFNLRMDTAAELRKAVLDAVSEALVNIKEDTYDN